MLLRRSSAAVFSSCSSGCCFSSFFCFFMYSAARFSRRRYRLIQIRIRYIAGRTQLVFYPFGYVLSVRITVYVFELAPDPRCKAGSACYFYVRYTLFFEHVFHISVSKILRIFVIDTVLQYILLVFIPLQGLPKRLRCFLLVNLYRF